MNKIIYLILILAVGVIGCPGGVSEQNCDTNDCCIETASCIPQSDGNWCTVVGPMNIEIEEWLQASVGNPYQVSVTAVGGFGPYTWELIRSDEEKLEWLTIKWDGDGSTAFLVNKDGEFPTKADVGDIDLTLRLIDASLKGTDNRVDNLGFNLKKTLTIGDTAAAPIFDPDPGTYNSDQLVSISCDTADAKIFYTTNGDDPTTSSTEYTSPISVAGDQTNMTIKAISSKDGLANSIIVEGTYIISYGHVLVIYHGNGNTSGDAPIDLTDYNYEQQVNVLDQGDLLKTGYIFACWNTKSNGTGEDYAPGSTFNIGEDNVNLYAQWTPIQYTVTFDSQGGSTVDPQTVNYGEHATAPANPTNAGYYFGGWYKESGYINVWNFSIDTVTANVTLYAKWTLNQYTVTFDSQGGSDVDEQLVYYGALATKPLEPSIAGFLFGGWYKEPECSNAWDFDSDTVTADVELYAQWTNTQTQILGGVSFNMKYVPGGTFPTGINNNGIPGVSNAFWIGETEVTYKLWSEVYAWAENNDYIFANPGYQGSATGTTDQHPVTYISWRDAIVWCNAASEMAGGVEAGYEPVYKYNGAVVRDSRDTNATACDGVIADSTAKGYRLPLSMEWECAARYRGTDETNSIEEGGIYWTRGNSASGATASYLDEEATKLVAWYSEVTTHTVKGRTDNALGVYDMSGNVYEWCFDKYGVSVRVIRGGCFYYTAASLQLGLVGSRDPDYVDYFSGFRFLRTL